MGPVRGESKVWGGLGWTPQARSWARAARRFRGRDLLRMMLLGQRHVRSSPHFYAILGSSAINLSQRTDLVSTVVKGHAHRDNVPPTRSHFCDGIAPGHRVHPSQTTPEAKVRGQR